MFIFGLFGCCYGAVLWRCGVRSLARGYIARGDGGLRDREAAHVIVKSSGKRNYGQPATPPHHAIAHASMHQRTRGQRRVFTCRAPGQLPMEMWRRSSVEGGGMS